MYSEVHGTTSLFFTTLHCSSLYFTVLHCTSLIQDILRSTWNDFTILHCTSLFFTALHCTSLYFTNLLPCTPVFCSSGLLLHSAYWSFFSSNCCTPSEYGISIEINLLFESTSCYWRISGVPPPSTQFTFILTNTTRGVPIIVTEFIITHDEIF